MKDYASLPNAKRDLARVIEAHILREEARLAWRYAMWRVSWEYLVRGVRRFTTFDIKGRMVGGTQLDDKGNLEFRSEEMLRIINESAGRIAAADFRPVVSREGTSLGAVQDAAVAQVLMDWQVPEDHLKTVLEDFGYTIACLGCAGICAYGEEDPFGGYSTELEVVHPIELFPFPSIGINHLRSGGIIRQRWISEERVRKAFPRVRIDETLTNMADAEYGAVAGLDPLPPQQVSGGTGYVFTSTGTNAVSVASRANAAVSATQRYIQIRECWLRGPTNRVTRYVVTSGHQTLHDISYEDDISATMPIAVARFYNNGSFHGAGVFDLNWGLVRASELLLKRAFNNAIEADGAGLFFLPQGQVNTRMVDTALDRRFKFLMVERDMAASENDKPFFVPYPSTGDIPGRTAAFAQSLIAAQNPAKDILAQKGRVDSAPGLAFLDEQVQQNYAPVLNSVGNAFSGIYRSILSQTVSAVLTKPRKIPLSNLTLDLAGVVIDPETRTISFPENPLPNLNRLSFKPRDLSPRAVSTKKTELLNAHQMGLMGPPTSSGAPNRLTLSFFREGIEPPYWSEDLKGAYKSVVLNILLIYGDGEVPGKAVITPYTSRADFQLVVLDAFLQGPKMQVASPEVHAAFKSYREALQQFLGTVLPPGVPEMEDLALQGQEEPVPSLPSR